MEKKKSRVSIWGKFKNHMVESLTFFCSKIGTHGFRYAVNPRFDTCDRVFWIVLTLSLSCFSGILLWFSIFINSKTPVVTVVESAYFPANEVPFPAVTICSFNKMSLAATRKIAGILKPSTNYSEEQLMEKLRLVHHFTEVGNAEEEEYLELNDILKANNLSVEAVTDALMPKCTSMVSKCFWRGIQVRCDSLFRPIITYYGRCCAFNFLGLKRYRNSTLLSSIIRKPRKTSAVGYDSGLSVLVNPEISDYFGAAFSGHGFRVIIHDSFDFPDTNSVSLFLNAGREALVAVTPETTYSREDVSKKDVSTRRCYNRDEMNMHVMGRYSYTNCIDECVRLISFDACKCVPYNFPRIPSDPVCQLSDKKCYGSVRSKYYEFFNNSRRFLAKEKLDTGGVNCVCLPSCDYHSYAAEVSTGILDLDRTIGANKLLEGIEFKNQSLIHVFYTHYVSTSYRRDLFQSSMQILAMFGGLTGLFIGFSLVSAYEIIYIFFFKKFFDILADRSIKRQLRWHANWNSRRDRFRLTPQNPTK